MAGIQRQIFAVVADAARRVPVPMIDVPDNITAPVIGPKNFRKYCVPRYNELAEMLADVGTLVYVHMDGDLKPLWKLIGESGVRGLDSLSPPPDNDTSVGQAHALWPEMRLCPNFPSSVHLAEPEVIYATARQILAEAGHSGRLQIQISENVPPGMWRKSFPQIVAAIREFGAP
jgi:uroporphyrinogen-III decarboxylase